MVYMWVDDMRPCPAKHFIQDYELFIANTVNDAMKVIRSQYKSGQTNFFLDLDNDASDEFSPYGGDYINILKQLEDMRHQGHIRNMDVKVHIHSMNPVAVQNMRAIIKANSSWMKEVSTL